MNDEIQKLITQAKSDTDEGWACIDEKLSLPAFADNKELLQWVFSEGLSDENMYVRDLAVSILEKSQTPLDDKQQGLLLHLIKTDENIYVQFRAAFALYARGIRNTIVIEKVSEAQNDPDVAEIAKEYLGNN